MKKIFSLFIIFIYFFVSSTLVHVSCMFFGNDQKKLNHSCHETYSDISFLKDATHKKTSKIDCRELSSTQNVNTSSLGLINSFSSQIPEYFSKYKYFLKEEESDVIQNNKSPPKLKKNFKSDVFSELVWIVKISVFEA